MVNLIKYIGKIYNSIYFLYGRWKTKILVSRGLQLGKNNFIDSTVFIDPVVPWLISIGDDCTLTKGVKILAHDASTKRFLNYTKVGRVSIGKRTFIGVNSVILPGVKIGENVIIGAGSIVTKDIPDYSVVAGNPAVVISSFEDFIKKHRENIQFEPLYEKDYTLGNGVTSEKKKKMNIELENLNGYIT